MLAKDKVSIQGGVIQLASDPTEMLSCRDARLPNGKDCIDAQKDSDLSGCRATRLEGPKILVVIAHPDDEQYFASTLYKLTNEGKAKADLVVVTNGEGGYPYSGPAEKIYGIPLASKEAAAENLSTVRKQEMKDAAKVLGVQAITALDQPDPRKPTPQETRDEKLILKGSEWDQGYVRAVIDEKLRSEKYDYVFTLLPAAEEHRAHKAAAITALEAVSALPAAERPVVLGARLSKDLEPCHAEKPELVPHPELASDQASPSLSFDRYQRFGPNDKMSYQMPAVWEMASHKSQGASQELSWTMRGENFQILGVTTDARKQDVINLFELLNSPSK